MSAHYKKYCSVVILFFLAISLHSLISPELDHGDAFSDANVLISGENYYNHGFAATYGLPVHNRIVPNRFSPEEASVYTHYPPLPEMINGALRMLGVNTLFGFRMFSIFISLFTALLLPTFFRQLGFDTTLGYICSFCYLLNFEFLRYFDSLYQSPYGFLTFSLFCIVWLKYLNDKSSYRWCLLILALIFQYINCWITFEYFPIIPIFALLSVLATNKLRTHWWVVGVIGGVSIVALLLRITHNGLYLGGFSSAVEDMLFASRTRSTIGWGQFLHAYQKGLINFSGPALILVVAYLLSKKKVSISIPRAQFVWAGIFFISASSWWFLMRQHVWVHHHPILLFLPFYSVFVGIFINYFFRIIKNSGKLKTFSKVILGISFLIMIGKVFNTPFYNKFYSISDPAHAVQQAKLQDINSLKFLAQQFSPEIKLLVSDPDRSQGYYLMKPFQYIHLTSNLTLSTDESVIVHSKTYANIVNDLKSKYPNFNQKDNFYIFTTNDK